jgi:V8-like Glu-specific endopeptidase
MNRSRQHVTLTLAALVAVVGLVSTNAATADTVPRPATSPLDTEAAPTEPGPAMLPGSPGTGVTDPVAAPRTDAPARTAKTVLGPDGRTRVTATTAYPASAIGHIVYTDWDGRTFVCTGWLIDANTVLTAGHCIYDVEAPADGTLQAATFYPGRDGDVAPFGGCDAVTVFSPDEWKSIGDWKHDWGLMQLDCRIGDVVGWFGLTSVPGRNSLTEQAIVIQGYPGEQPGTQWTQAGTVQRSEPLTMHYRLDTTGGQSGSPVFSASGIPGELCGGPCSIGIHAYSAAGTPLTNSGTRLTASRVSTITALARSNDAPAFVRTFGATGTATGQFTNPDAVATDDDGNIYVTDTGNHRIQKFTSTGTFLTTWGTPGNATGQFSSPRGIATDSAGNVYVADTGNHRIQKFASTGTFLTTWGTFGSSTGQFRFPLGIATDSAGNVYVADAENHRIQKFTSTGTFLTTWGTSGTPTGQFDVPFGIATDSDDNVYVTDTGNHRIQKFTSTGTFLTTWGTFGSSTGQFSSPRGIALDDDDNVYVTDTGNHRIQKSTGQGRHIAMWGSAGADAGEFNAAVGVATAPSGQIHVVDLGNNRVQTFGDTTAPTVTIRQPARNAVVPRGATVTVDFACADEATGSGLASCVGTTADGARLPTSTPGTFTLKARATDSARNTQLAARSYSVVLARPDVRAAAAGNRTVGDNVYAPRRQEVSASAAAGRSATYTLSFQNDARFADHLEVSGGPSTSSYRVTYRTASGTNVTSQVAAGTYRTPMLQPGKAFTIEMTVQVLPSAPMGSSLARTVTATSTTHQDRVDRIDVVTSRS